MKVQSEFILKLAQIETDFERGDSLIVKGNFYQTTQKLHEDLSVCICKVNFYKIDTANIYLIQQIKSN